MDNADFLDQSEAHFLREREEGDGHEEPEEMVIDPPDTGVCNSQFDFVSQGFPLCALSIHENTH